MPRYTCIASLTILAVSTRLLAAQTVQGIVVSEKSQLPVSHAVIALVDESGRVASTAVTDSSSGAFFLDVPRSGQYSLKVQVGRGGLSYSPAFRVDSNQTVEHKFVVPEWPNAVLEAYLPDDVTTKAAYRFGDHLSPRYPDRLRAAGRAGFTRAEFVVDAGGRADMNTFRVIESQDDAFSNAVRDYVERARFNPAKRDSTPVPQVFDMAVDFGFATEPSHVSGDNVIVVRALGVVRTKLP